MEELKARQSSQKVEPTPPMVDLLPLISDDDDVKIVKKESIVGSQTKTKNKTPFRFTSTRNNDQVLQNNDSVIESDRLEREARQRKEQEDKDRIDLQAAIELSQKQKQKDETTQRSQSRDIIGIGINH